MPEDKIYAVGATDPSEWAAAHLTSSFIEDWEVMGPLMHNVFDYGGTAELFKITVVRRGPAGILGLCCFLEYFVKNRDFKLELMEGKLKALEQAMEML